MAENRQRVVVWATGGIGSIAIRAGVYGCAPLLVAMVFGLDPAWGMLTVPFICFITGFGWAAAGALISALMKSIDNFSYVTSTLITPMFLVAGTFFPISGLTASSSSATPRSASRAGSTSPTSASCSSSGY